LALLGRFQNGDANLSASSIAMTLLMLAVLPAIGVGQAVMVLVGQHLGNNRSDEAQKVTYSGVQISFIYMSLAGLSFVLFPHFYTQFFAAENLNVEIWSQVEQMTPTLFIFVAYFCLFDSLNFNFSFALKGAGDTRFVSLLSLVLPWPFMVGPSFYIKDWDQAIFWAWGFAAFYASFLAMVLWWRFKGGKWKTMSVIRD
jgi:MATE family multidrug resistance protein